jgi:hypothetical protein
MTSNNITNGGTTAAATPLGLENNANMQQLDTNATDTINTAEYQLKDADVQDFDSKSIRILIVYTTIQLVRLLMTCVNVHSAAHQQCTALVA